MTLQRPHSVLKGVTMAIVVYIIERERDLKCLLKIFNFHSLHWELKSQNFGVIFQRFFISRFFFKSVSCC